MSGGPERGSRDEQASPDAPVAEAPPKLPQAAPPAGQLSADRDHRSFHGDVKDYRQPLVTSLGIILGFMLNFLASWSNSTEDGLVIENRGDALLAATITLSCGIFIVVLWRMLSPYAGDADQRGHYALTMRLYLLAVTISLVGFLLSIFV